MELSAPRGRGAEAGAAEAGRSCPGAKRLLEPKGLGGRSLLCARVLVSPFMEYLTCAPPRCMCSFWAAKLYNRLFIS